MTDNTKTRLDRQRMIVHKIQEWQAKLFGVKPPSKSVSLVCPELDIPFGDETTVPASYDTETGEAAYSCPVCLEQHRFRWGPPAPVYVGDVDQETVTVSVDTLADLAYHACAYGDPDPDAISEANALMQTDVTDTDINTSYSAKKSIT